MGKGFSVPQVILPLGPAITVPLAYCVQKICSWMIFLGGLGEIGVGWIRNGLPLSCSAFFDKSMSQIKFPFVVA